MATGCSYLLICMLMVHNNYTRVLIRVTYIPIASSLISVSFASLLQTKIAMLVIALHTSEHTCYMMYMY